MIIRKYGDFPATYAPDVGEVVLARKSPVQTFRRAVVLNVRRRREGGLRVSVQFLPGPGEEPTPPVTINTDATGRPEMIRQITSGQQ